MSAFDPGRRAAMAMLAVAPLLRPGRARAADAAPISTPIAVDKDRVWVAATIGASEPLLFVVDTGGALQTIRPEIASRLHLKVIGGETIHGLGKGAPRGAVVVAPDLRFASGLNQRDVVFTTFDFANGMATDAAGTLAAGLFTTRDSELDFDAGAWRLWPDGRRDRTGLTRMAAQISERGGNASTRLIATVAIDGAAYRMLLDTGASGILLSPRASARSGLFDDARPFAPTVTRGYGGLTAKPSRVVRAARFEMSPLAIDRPLVTLMDPAQANDTDDHDGLVGLDLLQLLTLSTEVRARALWGKRNDRAPPPERYRTAGLWLDRAAGGGAVVRVVGTGSPAAQAGMRVGDPIADPPVFADALKAVQSHQVALAVTTPTGVARRRWTNRPYL